jgi:hypothetical protein
MENRRSLMRKIRPLTCLVVALACSAGLTTGCSSTSTSSGSSTKPSGSAGTADKVNAQPIADFRAQADPICERIRKRNAKLTLPSSFPADIKDFDKGSKALIAAISDDYPALAKLKPPAGHEDDFARFSGSLSAVVTSAGKVQDLVKAGNEDTDALWLPVVQVKTDQGVAMDAAVAMGLSSCEDISFSKN